MKLLIAKGTTSFITHVFLEELDSGDPITGLAFNTASLAIGQHRSGGAAASALTLLDIATLGTYVAPTSAAHIRFKEVGASAPGLYELQIHNTNLDSSFANLILIISGATNLRVCPVEIQLLDSALGTPSTAGLAAIETRLLDTALAETGVSIRGALRVCLAFAAGVRNITGNVWTFLSAGNGSKTRISGTLVDGERSAITLDTTTET